MHQPPYARAENWLGAKMLVEDLEYQKLVDNDIQTSRISQQMF